MKKILLMFFLAAILGVTSEKAFAQQFEKGDKLLNVGINLGGTYGGGGIGAGASYEGGVHDFISVGGQFDFVHWGYGGGIYGYGWNYNFISIGARGSYHFGKHFLTIDNLDLYAGPALGYRIASSSYDGVGYDAYGSGVFFGAFAGARYYFKPTIGVFAEVGYNASPLKAGLTFKF